MPLALVFRAPDAGARALREGDAEALAAAAAALDAAQAQATAVDRDLQALNAELARVVVATAGRGGLRAQGAPRIAAAAAAGERTLMDGRSALRTL